MKWASSQGRPATPIARPPHQPASPWARHSHLLLPAIVVLLAFALRVCLLPQVPFGWHPDEASKALLARDVLAGKYAPAFFTAFTGRDALYVYLEAAVFGLFGESIFAGRVLSAFVGVLTVAATYALGKAMASRRTGLLAALLLATSLWHLVASRNGYRAVVQPLVQIPVLLLLVWEWRGGSRRPWLSAVVAGFFLGLTQYTYTAARAFPLLVAIVVILVWALEPSLVRGHGRWLLAMVGTAAVVLIPLVVYFIRNPFDLYGRAIQVSVAAPEWSDGDMVGRLGRSVVETALMFSAWGDPNYRFNVAGRPVFGPVVGLAFYGGIAVCLWNVIRQRGWRRAACLLLLVWVPVMLLPMTLSAESLPYFQRAIGILPALTIIPAIALDTAFSWASTLFRRVAGSRSTVARAIRLGGAAVLALFVLGLSWRVTRAYFGDWHSAARNDSDRRVAMVYAADYLADNPPADPLYISSEYPQHPTLAFLAPDAYQRTRWFDARQSLPLPPEAETATYVLLRENAPEPSLLAAAPDLSLLHTGVDRVGRPAFDVYGWAGGALPVPEDASPAIWSYEVALEPGDPNDLRHEVDLPVSFGDVLAFTGHDRNSDSVKRGDALHVILHWHLLGRPDRHYSMFVHLLDEAGQVVAEYDANRYPATFWREDGGETLLSFFPLWISPDTSPGVYRLEMGVYHQPTGERLAVVDDGDPVADRLLLRPVTVE